MGATGPEPGASVKAKRAVDKRLVRLLAVVPRPDLRSIGKGANRTPPDRAAGLVLAGRGVARVVRRRFVGRFAARAGVSRSDEENQVSATTASSAEHTRRDFLYIATGAVGAIGAVGVAWPLIAQMNPDASTIAAGAPIEVDLAPIAEGQVIKVFWRGKPIFISHRTKKEIDEARNVNVASLPDPQPDQQRVKEGHDQWQVLIGICTHLGCIPIAHQGTYNGYFCPCHGSVYDTSGRIRSGPAPANLPLPPYAFLSDTKIRIG
jgi:ubiquinol-cytochrome c reductase iron-sulfur subunit